MAEDHKPGAPSEIHLSAPHNKINWLAWILLGLGILAALYFLTRGLTHQETPVAATNGIETADQTVVPQEVAPVSATQTIGTYLGGTEVLPRRFALDKPNFDTGKSVVRDEDKSGIDDLVGILKQYPNAKARLIGFADTTGTPDANAKLGADRAAAVKAALVAGGIDGGRIATATGGANDPVASNATAGGRSENRRTEIEVTAR